MLAKGANKTEFISSGKTTVGLEKKLDRHFWGVGLGVGLWFLGVGLGFGVF